MTTHACGTRVALARAAIPFTLLLAACAPAPAAAPPAQATGVPPATSPMPATGASPAPPPTAAAAPSAAASPAAATAASNEEVARALAGKTITFTVGYSPGGGYDTMARMLAVHMPRHIPGNPKIIVENQAGSDSLVATQNVMRKKPDGLSVVVGANFLDDEALGVDVAGIDASNPPVILGTAYASWLDRPYFCTRSDVATTWDEALARGQQNPITMGMQVRGGWTEFTGTILKLPFKIVYGYKGAKEVEQALDRKEIEATQWCHPPSIKREFPEWIPTKFVTPIADFEGNPERHRAFIEEGGWQMPKPIEQLVKMTDRQLKVLEAYRKIGTSGGYLVSLPPATPDNVVTAMREALKATAEDPAYIQDMKTRNLIAGYRSGTVILQEFQDLRTQPEEIKADLRILAGN